jgi:hypothetical protein
MPSRPDSPSEPVRPEVAPPENPHRIQFSAPQPMPHYSLAPPDSCFQPRGPNLRVERLTAIPGAGQATVTWWDLGDPDTRSYELAIVSVGPPRNRISSTGNPVRYQSIAAPNTCKQVSVVIPQLISGASYRFWLLANDESQVQAGRTIRLSRGETETVTIN